MPITSKIDLERHIVYSYFNGVISEADIIRHGTALKSDPNFDPAFHEILDVRGITELEASSAMIQKIASSKSIFNPDSMHAIIAPAGLLFGLSRMFQMLSDRTRPNVAVVSTPEEADRYIAEAKNPG